MRASRRVLTLTGAAAALQTTAVLLATRAFAAPTPSPTPTPSPSRSSDCSLIAPPARDYCEQGGGAGSGGSTPSLTDTLDPLSSLAQGCAKAAAWTISKLSDAVKDTANVDFTNQKFLQQYAVVFAASTILTLLLWLLAVAKRAVRGVPLTTAISEAIGFLWLTVLASAFTPSSSTPSYRRPTASQRSSRKPPATRPTPSSAPSPAPWRRATTSAAAPSC